MDHKLSKVLVERGLLPRGTEVRAFHRANGLGSVNHVTVASDFSIVSSTVREDGTVSFRLADLHNGAQSTVEATAIETIDGMDPIRFADVYEITADGGKAVVGARRGRKPKNRQVVIEEIDDLEECEEDEEEY